MKIKLLLLGLIFSFPILLSPQVPNGDTYIQGFYWNTLPGGVWWDSLYNLSGLLKSAGFSAIWIPSANKGAGGGFSMGYDIYDHYDFGEYYQKGSIETRFGSKSEFIRMLSQYKKLGISVYYDFVLNHTAGGELKSKNACRTDSAYLIFNYPNGSRRFPKNADSFNPSTLNNCNASPPYNNNAFTFAEDNCTDNPAVRDSLIEWGKYIKNEFKIDGARLDAIKHVNPNFIANWSNQVFPGKYVVGEFWGSADEIKSYFDALAFNGAGNISIFDFPLRYTLESMCNNSSGSFDMRALDYAGLIRGKGMSGFNVSTFVENHDVDRIGWDGVVDTGVAGHQPIFRDKHLAYAYIMFSEGRPCVFFRDYFNYGLKGVIDTLIFIRHKFLGGGTSVRNDLNPYYIREDGNQDQNLNAQDIYVARRNGYENQPGGYLLINDNPTKWIDVWVDTDMPIGTVFKDYTGKDVNKVVVGPAPGGFKNRVKLWAPKRDFTIYVADTTSNINQAPVLIKIDNFFIHTNQLLEHKFLAYDSNNDSLTFSIQNNPSWLTLLPDGNIKGIPQFSDTGRFSNIILTVTDSKGASDKDTFAVTVFYNKKPVITKLSDTTATVTQRFERQIVATDSESDTLQYYLTQKPDWMTIEKLSGLISGTPAPADTGKFYIQFLVSDNKGGIDTSGFNILVKPKPDSILYTYAKPVIDGIITQSQNDWRSEWLRVADPNNDSKWTIENELYDYYLTWDADSFYIGITYTLKNNTLLIYFDTDISGGETNFNSNFGYNGEFPRNFRFRSSSDIDLMVAGWNKETPRVYEIKDSNSVEISSMCNRKGTTQAEIAIAWNTLYKLGPGLVKPNAVIKSVAVIGGGENWGGGDAAPSNCDIELCPPGTDTLYQGPDSLIILDTLYIDKNGNGIPDPTVILTGVFDKNKTPLQRMSHLLSQNYPNPFNAITKIFYSVKLSEKVNRTQTPVKLIVYDILGKEIKVLVNDYKKSGDYAIDFNAEFLPSGIYYYVLKYDDVYEVKKMVILK